MTTEPPDPGTENTHIHALRAVRAELDRLERSLTGAPAPPSRREPAWQRRTEGEPRLWVAVTIVAAALLQWSLPDRLAFHPALLLPALEIALLALLLVLNPGRITRESVLLRAASLLLIGVISLANGWSAVRLVLQLLGGGSQGYAQQLLTSGIAIWLTNVVVFALWYWEFDRGGPAVRATGRRTLPDFQFPQMQSPRLAHPDWEPTFVDYLYLSFTNAVAFSPTDVMPLSRWAKMTMLLQSLVSLVTVALVIARAINVLK